MASKNKARKKRAAQKARDKQFEQQSASAAPSRKNPDKSSQKAVREKPAQKSGNSAQKLPLFANSAQKPGKSVQKPTSAGFKAPAQSSNSSLQNPLFQTNGKVKFSDLTDSQDLNAFIPTAALAAVNIFGVITVEEWKKWLMPYLEFVYPKQRKSDFSQAIKTYLDGIALPKDQGKEGGPLYFSIKTNPKKNPEPVLAHPVVRNKTLSAAVYRSRTEDSAAGLVQAHYLPAYAKGYPPESLEKWTELEDWLYEQKLLTKEKKKEFHDHLPEFWISVQMETKTALIEKLYLQFQIPFENLEQTEFFMESLLDVMETLPLWQEKGHPRQIDQDVQLLEEVGDSPFYISDLEEDFEQLNTKLANCNPVIYESNAAKVFGQVKEKNTSLYSNYVFANDLQLAHPFVRILLKPTIDQYSADILKILDDNEKYNGFHNFMNFYGQHKFRNSRTKSSRKKKK